MRGLLGLLFFAPAAHEAALPAPLGRWSLCDCPALLASGGAWLELGLRPQTFASPDPPAAALLGTAQGWHGAQPHAPDEQVGRAEMLIGSGDGMACVFQHLDAEFNETLMRQVVFRIIRSPRTYAKPGP